jgi:folate-dependent phosphoribosylglycinamide formyltransferase PurN
MPDIKKFISSGGRPRAAIFMSGSGSNAERLLKSLKKSKAPSWEPAVIVTDAPLTSRAREIASANSLPLVENDIREFYRRGGEPRVSLRTERGRELRELWTAELREALKPFDPAFGILAGFVPLCNITADMPCLNVHPGDLTVEENGERILAGLHTVPIERAIIEGHRFIRTSVIIAGPYTGAGGGMDGGHIIGLSEPVEIDMKGFGVPELRKIRDSRPSARPAGGFKDRLEEIAEFNQNRLKELGDWIVFPPAVSDFAAGLFGEDSSGALCCLTDGEWRKIKTVIYSASGKREPVAI